MQVQIFDVVETKDGEIGIIKEISKGNIKIEIFTDENKTEEKNINEKTIKKILYKK